MSASAESNVRGLLQAARQQLCADIAYFTKFTEGAEHIDFLAGDSSTFAFGEGSAIPLGETYCQRMIEGTAPRIVPNVALEPRMQDLAAGETIGSYLGVPVRLSDGRIYGTVCCASNHPDESLSAAAEAHIRVLADGLANLVESSPRESAAAAPRLSGDALQLRLWFAGVARAPSSARVALTVLEPHLDEDRLLSLRLVITELMTNCIRHSGMDDEAVVGLDIRLQDGVLRCTVSDPGSGFEKPEVVKPHEDRPGGFGLVILDSVAESWGVERDELFRVWFELAV
ncbi:MAG: ATP-binding protein [Actinomycetota bacterium]|nr:ATP-binding protein [Actinomycetota bacterium]